MKYIIDMVEDIRQNIHNASDYTLLAMLLKEDASGELKYAGEKVVNSFYVDHDSKQFVFGFLDEDATTKELVESLNALDINSMMYEVLLKISDNHPLMPVVGFGEDHKQKLYSLFVTL